MASHVPEPLNLIDKVLFALLIPRVLLVGTLDLVRRTWIRKSISSKNLKRDLQRASVSSGLDLLSTKQSRALGRTSGQVIVRDCESKHLRHESIPLNDTDDFPPATLHFVDCSPQDAGRVYLYFHGGGYTMPFQAVGFPLMEAKVAGASLAVLEYSLAPESKYPAQLAQAAAALRFLLKSHIMSDIIIGGDSAGGNLTLSLLAHLQQPHPRITPITTPNGAPDKLLGAIATSARTSDKETYQSITSNAGKDYMSVKSLQSIITNWSPLPEVWAGASYGDAAFWSNIRAERVLLLVGGDEIYRDGVIEAGKLMGAREAAGSPVQIVICPDEVHVQLSMDYMLGITDGHMLTAATSWLSLLG